jgi:hypothetical protein
MRVSEMTYDEWYSEWKEMLDEATQAQRAVADYAANHGMTIMEEWPSFTASSGSLTTSVAGETN